MSNIANDESKKAIKFAKAAFRLYQLGSAGFCETLIKVFGRYGEKTYQYWEKKEEIEALILGSVRRASKEEIGRCLNLLLSIFGEIESDKMINLISQLLEKIDPVMIKRILGKLIKNEIISKNQLSKQIKNNVNNLDTRKLSKLLITLGDFIEQDTINVIVNQVSSSDDPIAKHWLNVYRVERMTQSKICIEIDHIIENIAYSLSYENIPIKVLDRLLLLYLLYGKLELKEKKKLEEKIKPYAREIFLKVSTIDTRFFDKPLGEAFTWLLSMLDNIGQEFERLLSLMIDLVKKDIIENVENIAELLTRIDPARIERTEAIIFSISKSSNWKLRELSLLLSQLVYNKTRKEKWLKFIKSFCNDKRSIIRKTCSNFLLQVMEREIDKVTRTYYSSVLTSKDTQSIAKLLILISNLKPNRGDLQYVIDRAIKVPRSTIYNAILNILNQHWKKIDTNKLVEYLHKILSFSRGKKTLKHALKQLVKEIASSSNIHREKLKDIIEDLSSEENK